ncbi:unnamed protein product [Didymodactylos carnosus]|uniref:Uncharacterized protein n=1 Tax=Didymodactylos carnosus TaxID=1234261 RepID=A0A815EIA2_9BILA|nr:unnamed protein product [Didymodactylos carnosus]CAF1307018.1 unnamed protein product [Didymodactylos carnosus]CAF3930949.1 unnamed protein product [Didymodactylos carnosus]CAF4141056.1 unnamed protein product [Didymodactylos carnosus]
MAQAVDTITAAAAPASDSSAEGLGTVPPWAQHVISQSANLGIKLFTYQQHTAKVAIVDNARGLLNAPGIEFPQRVTNLIDYKTTNSTVLLENCFLEHCGVPDRSLIDTAKGMTPDGAKSMQQNMLKGLDGVKQQMASDYLLVSAIASTGLIVVQIIKLWNVWKEIKLADNLHKDPNKFLEIEQNMLIFEDLCTKVRQSIDRKESRRILSFTMKLSNKYAETLKLVNSLQIKIENVMQRLDLAGDSQIYDGLSNLITGGSNVAQLIPLFESLSNPKKALGCVMAGAFFVLIGFNVAMYHMTRKRLQELREDYQKLQQLELQFKKLNSDIQLVLEEEEERQSRN